VCQTLNCPFIYATFCVIATYASIARRKKRRPRYVKIGDFYRAMLCITVSVCLSRSWIMSKRINISLKFSINILLHLRNNATESHSYYGSRIGCRNHACEWYEFQWPPVTCKPRLQNQGHGYSALNSGVHHYLTLNISETVRDTDILRSKY